ncbi:MAG: OsmC family protein [Polyangiaceae bacterium]|nr:OsmC family protein [Polyangiaceae bacterium]
MTTLDLTLRRVGPVQFEASDARGHRVLVEGSTELGGRDEGMRPMEMFLVALASCSAIDVVHILERKQKHTLEQLVVRVRGVRADAVPAVFTEVELAFEATGNMSEKKLARAVALSVEKYCSVTRMLEGNVVVRHTYRLSPSAG